MSRKSSGPTPPVSPFTVSEIGEPGNLRAIADFTCPRCQGHTRFFTKDEREDGGFVCPRCGLVIEIEGSLLSDYQRQLDSLNEGLGNFAQQVGERLRAGAERLARQQADEVAIEGEASPSPGDDGSSDA